MGYLIAGWAMFKSVIRWLASILNPKGIKELYDLWKKRK
jgi:hypothetical protein